ncbi:hypothetical protein C8J57DRAFT_1538573 [Mycena rebaudengoi]|nr:hypothetical protein C8J57DRAFT_1538573 [Mycena rebaudengoi]
MPVLTRSKTAAPAPVPVLAAHPRPAEVVHLNDELYHEIITRLHLSDLTKLATLSKQHALDAKRIFTAHVRRYTLPFFKDNLSHKIFFQTLESCESWIVASVAQAILTLDMNPNVPDELNVIASYLREEVWAMKMLQVLGYKLLYNVRASDRYQVVGDRHMAFVHPKVPGKCIAFTTSTYDVITANVEMTSKRTAFEGWDYSGRPSRSPFPRMGRSAYGSESGSDYVGVLFGEITETNFAVARPSCKLGPGHLSTKRLFQRQVSGVFLMVLADHVTDYRGHSAPSVLYPSDFNTPAGPTGTYLEIHFPFSADLSDTELSIGDWILMDATFHREQSSGMVRVYRIVAQRIHKLHLEDVPPLIDNLPASFSPALLRHLPPWLPSTHTLSTEPKPPRRSTRITPGPGPRPLPIRSRTPDGADHEIM